MRCPAAFTCFAYGCFSVVLSVPVLAAAVEPDSPSLKALEGSLFADGFEVGDPSMWTRSEPNGATVSGVAPDNGVAGGGDMLTITGSQFTEASDVQLTEFPASRGWSSTTDTSAAKPRPTSQPSSG